MKRQAPEPLNIKWKCKSIETARSGFEILADGRIHCWIEHDLIHDATPQMLVWWFKHLEGDILYGGQLLNRYRVWHPRDHIAIEYSRRNPDGLIGVGKLLNSVIRTFIFDEARGRAWIKHNVEEVGNFEAFLPQLYAIEGAA